LFDAWQLAPLEKIKVEAATSFRGWPWNWGHLLIFQCQTGRAGLREERWEDADANSLVDKEIKI
jgi:hypothetical protein